MPKQIHDERIHREIEAEQHRRGKHEQIPRGHLMGARHGDDAVEPAGAALVLIDEHVERDHREHAVERAVDAGCGGADRHAVHQQRHRHHDHRHDRREEQQHVAPLRVEPAHIEPERTHDRVHRAAS